MKKYFLTTILIVFFFAKSAANSADISSNYSKSALVSEYETSVTFPAGYSTGNYIEFLGLNPISAGASGYYQISISYTRGNMAAAATHLASISHANPALWRETGRINSNPYVGSDVNFTVDCNTEYSNPRFRIRAINTLGVNTDITVYIKVTSLNLNSAYVPLNATGTDLTVTKYLPMTSDWALYVGDVVSSNGASIAIKALQNGNIGIGTSTPTAKLTVAGNIKSREVNVTVDAGADFVFEKDYDLPSLTILEAYIKNNKHLPEIAPAKAMQQNGINLSEMNIKLLQKIEEMTLYIIELNKRVENLEKKKN